jgi:isopentenyldiphosphate isomerase
MENEQILEVDAQDIPIGLRTIEDFHIHNILHRSSALLLFNSNNELLLQKRTMTKKWFPGLFDYTVSGTLRNESYEEGMTREIKEELGKELPFSFLFKILPSEKNDKAFHSIFKAVSNEPIIYKSDETEYFQWYSLAEIEKDIEQNPQNYTPQLLIGLNKYFNLNKNEIK